MLESKTTLVRCLGQFAAIALLVGCGASKRTVERGTGGTGGSGAETGGTGHAAGEGGEASSVGGTAGKGSGGSSGSGGAAGSQETPPDCSVIPGTSQIPRLTNEQYERTVEQLLGVTTLDAMGGEPPSTILADDHSGALTDVGWSAYQAVGEAIAAQVMATPALRSRFLDCPADAEIATCLHDTVISFGRRAFRRPVTPAEIERFEKIVAAGPQITATGSLDEVAEVVLQTFLVSPSFLQRSEIAEVDAGSGRFELSPFEVAARLSYMLWQSPPDAELNQAADAGELTTKEQVRAQAERMLGDPKAHDFVTGFHRRYLGFQVASFWENIQKDPDRFPAFTPAARSALIAEMDRFFEQLVFQHEASFPELFSSPLGYVNADTAPIYGLDPNDFGAELKEVSFDPAQRPGFLTRAAFLASRANWNSTNPIVRGSFIMRRILGYDIDIPEHAFLPSQPAGPLTNRERVSAMSAAPACAGCHMAYIDPPGFVLEAYDAVGAWQTVEADTGAPIDTAADVLIDDVAVPVSGPAELMQALADSKQARHEYTRRWVSFAYTRENDPADACDVDRIADRLTATGYTIQDLIVDLTQTDSFRIRALEEDP